MKRLVIFGAGKIADVMSDYFSRDSDFQVVAHTCEPSFASDTHHRGLPLIPYDDLSRRFPPESCWLHVAVGYHQLNRVRERIFLDAKARGYRLASYVSSRSWPGKDAEAGLGENCFVADGVSLEAGAKIGSNVALWSNVVVGHHSEIRDHCWIAAGTAIGGSTIIGERCFLALNATVGNEVEIGADSLLGARTLVTRSLANKSVVVERDTEIFRLDSDRFLRISKLR